jgi:hypothetical protein
MEKDRRVRNIQGQLNVGADDTGYDVTFYGATSGCKFLWDESADKAYIQGVLNVTGAVTLEAAARVYKEVWFGARDFDVTASGATVGQYSSSMPTITIVSTNSNATFEDIYAWAPTPDDIDTAACMTGYCWWSCDTATGGDAHSTSQYAQMAIQWGHYASGEASPATTASTDVAKFIAGSSGANYLTKSTLSSAIDPPSAGELMGFKIRVWSSGSATTGSDMQVHGLQLRYRAAGLGTAT